MKTKPRSCFGPIVVSAIVLSAFTMSNNVDAADSCRQKYQTRIEYLTSQLRAKIIGFFDQHDRDAFDDACAQMKPKFDSAYSAYVGCLANETPVRWQPGPGKKKQ